MNKLILKYKEVLAILCSNYKLPVSLPCCRPSCCHVCTPTCRVMSLSCQCPSCCHDRTPTCHAMGCCCPSCCCHPAARCAAMSTLPPVVLPHLHSHLSCCHVHTPTCRVTVTHHITVMLLSITLLRLCCYLSCLVAVTPPPITLS